ncbi:MAG: hypothetical protein AAFY57_09440 [Cyanobacteria bacterium J06642_2]
MARTKLTVSDRKQLVELYRNSSATLQDLATKFEVSYSTASRIVKDGIPTVEYRALVKAKRGGDRKSPMPSPPVDTELVTAPEATQPSLLDELSSSTELGGTATDDKDISTEEIQTEETREVESAAELEEPEVVKDVDAAIADEEFADDDEFEDEPSDEEASIAAEFMGDERDVDNEGEDIDASLDEDYDDLDDDDDEIDDDEAVDLDEDDIDVAAEATVSPNVRVLDLEDIDLPQRIYAVVDRFQELSAAPLADFKHIGNIPAKIAQASTLPLFDEHRVARRFADRSKRHGRQKNRPFAFPGHYVWVTRAQLRAKGIEYLLYDGQVYAL